MNAQPALFNKSLEERFYEWMDTPNGRKVSQLFVRIAVGFKARGQKVGAKLIAERIRWHYIIIKQDEDYCVNNNYVAYLARWAMKQHDFLNGYFSLRGVK